MSSMTRFLSTPSARRATRRYIRRRACCRDFIHALREEGDIRPASLPCGTMNFIHALREEGDTLSGLPRHTARYFIHALREGDDELATDATGKAVFLSTPSARRATLVALRNLQALLLFLSTPSARRATSAKTQILFTDFYPRPPRGGRHGRAEVDRFLHTFLSTPSARRATRGSGRGGQNLANFYPRPPRGGRRAKLPPCPALVYFYPRPPRGGRQGGVDGLSNGRLISIHARRATIAQPGQLANLLFLSTPSARRATLTGVMV